MAWLPAGLKGQIQITEIGDGHVVIIERPGLADEKVLWKYDGRNSRELVIIKDQVFNSDVLTAEQKFYAGFWMGYFYAHLSNSARSFRSN
jgi:hypothetical protein